MVLIVLSFYQYVKFYFDDYSKLNYSNSPILWNPSALFFALGMSIGIVALVYGFIPFLDVIKTLFSKSNEMTESMLDKQTSFLDFLIKIACGFAKIGMILSFVYIFNRMFTFTGSAKSSFLKHSVISEVLLAYLFSLSAVFILFVPIKKILKWKMRKIADFESYREI